MSTAVWNVPDKNLWVTAMMGSIKNHLELPQPPAGAPGMFRCAQDGHMVELFRAAGLQHLEQHEIPTTLNSGTTEVYWEMMNDVAAPVVSALAAATDSQREAIKRDVFDIMHKRFPNGNVVVEASALVIVGRK